MFAQDFFFIILLEMFLALSGAQLDFNGFVLSIA